MEPTTVGVIAGVLTLASFLFTVSRTWKKDVEHRRDKVTMKLDECLLNNTKNVAAIRRAHERIDTVEKSQAKQEDTLSRVVDKLETKLDKIMDFLLDTKD